MIAVFPSEMGGENRFHSLENEKVFPNPRLKSGPENPQNAER